MPTPRTEREHVVPKYLGGQDGNNITRVSLPIHFQKHFFGACFPEPEQSIRMEFGASMLVARRLNQQEALDTFFGLMQLGAEMGLEEVQKAKQLVKSNLSKGAPR